MKEADIRPQALFNEYLELARRDAELYFADRGAFIAVACPACGSNGGEFEFEKLGFQYLTCPVCSSLYLNPRPPADQIHAYYREGSAVKFWATDFFRVTAEARREQMFRPRAVLAANLLSTYGGPRPHVLADIGSGYGIFLEELRNLNVIDQLVGIEPSPQLAEVCREKGFTILEKPAEMVTPGELQADVACAFEVLEHLSDPLEFLTAVRPLLAEGGILLFTTLTSSGFDIQTLWDHSKSVHPPHHVNLLSVHGLELLVKRAGYEVLDIETPGRLDVDILRNALIEDPSLPVPRFARGLALEAPDKVRSEFQEFLSRNRLSSHIRVVARSIAGG